MVMMILMNIFIALENINLTLKCLFVVAKEAVGTSYKTSEYPVTDHKAHLAQSLPRICPFLALPEIGSVLCPKFMNEII